MSKELIINRFKSHVQGRKADTAGCNKKHDGAEGHWLEKQMGITPNAKNEPDLHGYEMKKGTSSKTTFGDWSPDIAIWKKNAKELGHERLDRDTKFLIYFGKPNAQKQNRPSWSGEPAPKITGYNNFGQRLKIENDNIYACYSYNDDKRIDKSTILPLKFQKNNEIILAHWQKESLQRKLEDKFNANGWFICNKNAAGIYVSISFGKPINYKNWLELVKDGTVFFDSGMHAGNPRPYANWRANNDFWKDLIVETFK